MENFLVHHPIHHPHLPHHGVHHPYWVQYRGTAPASKWSWNIMQIMSASCRLLNWNPQLGTVTTQESIRKQHKMSVWSFGNQGLCALAASTNSALVSQLLLSWKPWVHLVPDVSFVRQWTDRINVNIAAWALQTDEGLYPKLVDRTDRCSRSERIDKHNYLRVFRHYVVREASRWPYCNLPKKSPAGMNTKQ